MTQAVDRLVRHVAATRFQDLPAAAVTAVKTFCLDTIGVSISGTAAGYAAEMRAAVGEWGSGHEATVLGVGNRLPASAAAMVNAFHAHNQEFDCVHEAAVVHPLTTIQSAALAVAERAGGVAGRELILALALGVDVATSIGMAAKTGLRFFRPATAGVFGATAAVGKLAGLDAVGLKNALGLAYAQNAGTMQSHVEGGPALALQMGFAAGAAVRAVDLARAGHARTARRSGGSVRLLPTVRGRLEPGIGVGRVGNRLAYHPGQPQAVSRPGGRRTAGWTGFCNCEPGTACRPTTWLG